MEISGDTQQFFRAMGSELIAASSSAGALLRSGMAYAVVRTCARGSNWLDSSEMSRVEGVFLQCCCALSGGGAWPAFRSKTSRSPNGPAEPDLHCFVGFVVFPAAGLETSGGFQPARTASATAVRRTETLIVGHPKRRKAQASDLLSTGGTVPCIPPLYREGYNRAERLRAARECPECEIRRVRR